MNSLFGVSRWGHFWVDFDTKRRGLENVRSLGGYWNWWQMEVHMASTSYENRGLGREKSSFLIFVRFREFIFVFISLSTNLNNDRLRQTSWFRVVGFGGVGWKGGVLGRRNRRAHWDMLVALQELIVDYGFIKCSRAPHSPPTPTYGTCHT